MIPISSDISDKMQILVGDAKQVSDTPTAIFNPEKMGFLADLSRILLARSDVRAMPDVVSFAYWARRANLTQMAERIASDGTLRMGLGLSFHICPANVPINFAFSMAFGLLAGNTCVLRLPTRSSPTLEVMVEAIASLLREERHIALERDILLIHFDHNDELIRFWMSVADARIVWGGDATVEYMRSMSCPPRSREVAFPDRYSICAIGPVALLDMSDGDIQALCVRLFNDMYLMDQAACSSPQLLAWIGEPDIVASAKARLWPELARLAATRYVPQGIQVMDKYVQACRHAVGNDKVTSIKRHGNQLYRIELSGVSERQDEFRGYFGTIHEVTFSTLAPLAPIINERYQTLTYFGLDPAQIKEFIAIHKLRGIDRVVPIGKALDMDIVWDGYDIVASLSRQITIQ